GARGREVRTAHEVARGGRSELSGARVRTRELTRDRPSFRRRPHRRSAPTRVGDSAAMGDPRPLDLSVCKRADLLDLGAGNGRRIRAEAKQFASKHPIGIDRNARKVARAQERGLPVYCADFTALDPGAFPAARVVVFDNVLEHLPSVAEVEVAFG